MGRTVIQNEELLYRSQPKCPICGKSTSKFVQVDSHSVMKCIACGHGFLFPFPPADELHMAYTTSESAMANSDSFSLLRTYLEDPSSVHHYYKHILAKCEAIVGRSGKGDPRILDFGCSCGVLLRCLKDIGYQNLLGIDINKYAAEEGFEKLDVPIVTGSVENLMADDGGFDLILALAILEHMENPKEFLLSLKSKLEKGGHIFFIVPNFDGFIRVLMGEKWLWYMPPFHLHHFTVKSVRALFEEAGLEEIELSTTNTGTYLFLIYSLLFGVDNAARTSSSSRISLRWGKRLDFLVRLFLFPLILFCRLFDAEPHIVGVFANER